MKPIKTPYKLLSAARLFGYSRITKGGYTQDKARLMDKFGRCCLFTFETLSIANDGLEYLKNEVVIRYNPN